MKEALLLMIELGSMVVLLLAIRRASKPGGKQDLGLFAYKAFKEDATVAGGRKAKRRA